MAEKSILWTTDGTGDGAEEGYADSDLFQLFRSFCPTANLGGVAPNVLNELEVTGTATPVSVASGQALVYGIPYFNSAAVNVTIPTPAAFTRIDRIVLRADWTAQTVRITRIAGSEGGSAPALTQTAGTTWDIPLAQVSIDTGGVITVTDEREWVGSVGPETITSDMLADDAVTRDKIANNAIDPRNHISGTNGIVVDRENGNPRGNNAVDLQTSRVDASQVASGDYSVIAGGEDNWAGGTYAVIGGGENNSILPSSNASVIGGGSDNWLGTNTDSGTIAGGTINRIDTGAIYGAIGGGRANLIDDNTDYATISGGYQARANKYGQEAHASGAFSGIGDAQRSTYTARNSTSDATETELFLDGSSSRLVIDSDTTWAFVILIVARRTDQDGESAAYELKGCVDNNAGTVALVGTVAKTVLGEDTAAWDVTAEADDTNNALVIKVTGEANKTIRWVATIWTTEVFG